MIFLILCCPRRKKQIYIYIIYIIGKYNLTQPSRPTFVRSQLKASGHVFSAKRCVDKSEH